MARRPRLFASGLLYHVIARGNQRRKTFQSPEDYEVYLKRLESYQKKYQIRLFAYCLMPNHVHLLLETGSVPLSKFMQGLQQSYTQYFNLRHRKVGHLFQGRYKAIVCDKDEYLLALVRYIHLNPVRAGLVQRADRYLYSGHGQYLRNTRYKIIQASPVLRLLGGKKRYEQFVANGVTEGHNDDYYSVKDQRFLGDESFGEELSRQYSEHHDTEKRMPIEAAVQEVAKRINMEVKELKGRERRWTITRKRADAIALLVWEYGFKVTEVASFLRRDQANVSLILARRADSVEKKFNS